MNTFDVTWRKLAKSKKYREEFVGAFLKRSIPFQIRTLRRKRGWSQELLAQNANVTQGVVSRAEDPNYGNLTFNTIIRIAAGFGVAFVGKFVPFSELARWANDLSEVSVEVPSFEEENNSLATLNERASEGRRHENVIPFDEILARLAGEVHSQAASALVPPPVTEQARPSSDYTLVIGAGSQSRVGHVAPSREDRPSIPRRGRDALLEGIPLPPMGIQERGFADAIIGGNPR